MSCSLSCSMYNGWSDRVEDGDGKEGSEIPGRWERVEIAFPTVYR